MQFSQITIENLFTYYGKTVFDFRNSEQPITLIIGENGFGKTSFINSIKIALHGITKDLLSIGELVLTKQDYILGNSEKNFSGLINRLSKKDGNNTATITLKIEDGDIFYLQRTFKALKNNYSESLVIYDGDMNKIMEEDEAQDFINSKISPTLAKFFFFDGEKIQTIADFTKHEFRQMLEDVLELDIYDQIIEDSEKVIRKIKKESLDTKSQEELTNKEEVLLKIQKDILTIKLELDDHTSSLKNTLSLQKDLDNKLSKLKGQYKEPLEDAKNRLSVEEGKLIEYQQKFKELCLYSLPLFFNKNLSKKVKIDIEDNYTGKISILQNIINIKKDEFLSLINSSDKEYIEKVFDKVFVNDAEKQSVQFADSTKIETQYKNIQKIKLKELLSNISKLKDEIKEIKNEILDLEYKKEKDQKEYELDFKKSKELAELVGVEKTKVEDLENTLNISIDQEKELKKELSKISIQDHKNEMAIKKIKTLESMILISSKMKDKIKEDKRELLETSINTKFKLLKKEGYEADFIKVDNNFNINIYDKDMYAMDILSSSSGQKQIIATALIWGISEYISEDIPMIIDTPLGRLDDKNQSLILTEFYPNASSQVLILPTPSELRNEGFDILETQISQIFTLKNAGSATNKNETIINDFFESRKK